MQIELKAPKIWLTSEPVDFRKAFNGLSEIVRQKFQQRLDGNVFIFFNRSRNKIKILAYHRNGPMLIYKQLDKKKFTLLKSLESIHEINQEQLSWLVAGLDWVDMSTFEELTYDDYF